MSNKKRNVQRVRVQLELSKRAKNQLDRKVAQSGLSLTQVASSLIEQAVGSKEVNESPADRAQRIAAWDSWVADMRSWGRTHLPRGHRIDDSRESIYEGCGE
jgi:hypothetical protein